MFSLDWLDDFSRGRLLVFSGWPAGADKKAARANDERSYNELRVTIIADWVQEQRR
jgi:hypothetical protein